MFTSFVSLSLFSVPEEMLLFPGKYTRSSSNSNCHGDWSHFRLSFPRPLPLSNLLEIADLARQASPAWHESETRKYESAFQSNKKNILLLFSYSLSLHSVVKKRDCCRVLSSPPPSVRRMANRQVYVECHRMANRRIGIYLPTLIPLLPCCLSSTFSGFMSQWMILFR